MLAAPSFGTAPFVIKNDRGGYVIRYALQTLKLRERGSEVQFLGTCASACTLYLALPAEQTCISERATFRFHAPYGASGSGNAIAHSYMMKAYPGWVRSWIARKGGLSKNIMVMGFDYASQFMKVCEDREDAALTTTAARSPSKSPAMLKLARMED